ncbi:MULTISPECIES: malate synthase G [Bacillaceae]|uniref:Malate synthase G n=1 Tax=Evansella alkalicola TaxID=745819 RepID=A0ABS6JVR4_9BACI|nr:malate synthase G [Litchfieldia alkalitelluris]MBU9722583.1 malate synthase G [Bacillus alkalicola]
MSNYVSIGKIQVAEVLYNFINKEALPESGVSETSFWKDYEKLLHDFMPKNKALLGKRETLQQEIKEWHQENQGSFDSDNYKQFLQNIGYLETTVGDFKITTNNVDDEITAQAGPQLVVPVNNARYALNAANARWGSLYDALYGTDVISEEDGATKEGDYNPIRGDKVIQFGREFLDEAVPLLNASHKSAIAYKLKGKEISVELENGNTTTIMDPDQLRGFTGNHDQIESILFVNNGLHIEVQFDPSHPVGKTDKAGVKDIVLESALTTIMDCEDSVAAVDAEDKTIVYSNLLGLMKGNLTETFSKGKSTVTRTLTEDREYKAPGNGNYSFTLPGRSLQFIRNVGHLMTTNAVLTAEGEETPEGIMDAVVTSLIAKHDLLGNSPLKNSRKGSIYLVKPKMHGSEEVAFSNELFNRVEDMLGLDRHTIKIGVMDEERRTSMNLKACINEVKKRVVFINTGFLDRTGDEIHTSMDAGPMIRKNEMKSSSWLLAYEEANVAVGLQSGFKGSAQIGKGMWAMPDLMASMLEQKIGHLTAGANTAWVPSPTAATLHALHYHKLEVTKVQNDIEEALSSTRQEELVNHMLEVPLAAEINWTEAEIQNELDNNAQGILGYVVRWINHGVGCSKVPDINNVALMEDRATLRISSQHIANWLRHGICTRDQVVETMERMAKVVDNQNASDPDYDPMSSDYMASIAFQAACDLVFEGTNQPSGYTEPILHRRRLELKERQVKGARV